MGRTFQATRHCAIERLEGRAMLTAMAGDFNGDGLDDVAIGDPFRNVFVKGEQLYFLAGVVDVLYGGDDAVQTWSQDRSGVQGAVDDFEGFGFALAVGDFNDDGFDDLAVGVPGDFINGMYAGAVNILYGSNKGLTAAGDQLLHQNIKGVAGAAEENDQFGVSLAAGDINGDEIDDLAVGAGTEAIGSAKDVGMAYVFFGSRSGLKTKGSQSFKQGSGGLVNAAEKGDQFGMSLAIGDFNGDGYGDLAVGVQGEAIATVRGAGAVHVLYGSRKGLTGAGDQLLYQGKLGLGGSPEKGDGFGGSLEAADFNGDGFDDLYIAVANEEIKRGDETFYGAGHVALGSADKLHGQDGGALNAEDFTSDETEVPLTGLVYDSLASGDFDRDGRAELVIGSPLSSHYVGEPRAAAKDDSSLRDRDWMLGTGAVVMLRGRNAGLDKDDAHTWDRGAGQDPDDLHEFDLFGVSVATGDFNGDGWTDLAVSIVNAEIDGDRWQAVQLIYGAPAGLTLDGADLIKLVAAYNNLWDLGSVARSSSVTISGGASVTLEGATLYEPG